MTTTHTCPTCDAPVDVTDGTAYGYGDGETLTIYCSRECSPNAE